MVNGWRDLIQTYRIHTLPLGKWHEMNTGEGEARDHNHTEEKEEKHLDGEVWVRVFRIEVPICVILTCLIVGGDCAGVDTGRIPSHTLG